MPSYVRTSRRASSCTEMVQRSASEMPGCMHWVLLGIFGQIQLNFAASIAELCDNKATRNEEHPCIPEARGSQSRTQGLLGVSPNQRSSRGCWEGPGGPAWLCHRVLRESGASCLLLSVFVWGHQALHRSLSDDPEGRLHCARYLSLPSPVPREGTSRSLPASAFYRTILQANKRQQGISLPPPR